MFAPKRLLWKFYFAAQKPFIVLYRATGFIHDERSPFLLSSGAASSPEWSNNTSISPSPRGVFKFPLYTSFVSPMYPVLHNITVLLLKRGFPLLLLLLLLGLGLRPRFSSLLLRLPSQTIKPSVSLDLLVVLDLSLFCFTFPPVRGLSGLSVVGRESNPHI
ncbi:hypothetical protein P175DRAFT_06270 [Aspergillus ochraceoroseus IBT 24754]|uniref:Uncharacterized protein n=1 Tax=Aspergillus ochraceoroseus IBT 24754 TaxID=1392256 RepID=A0A2T5M5J5_9EURO|nr:uncharacterized protein P175DRAFT_06270 [Aspergillus ochraceoroseus IBT 24754]PTU23802.1 hypothetical protein P175DRAFT_06270 [Aspergillus ochraceoroseus IBT 24754]